MEHIDHDGLLMCELQAEVFTRSAELTDSSSEIFIRRFMNSKAARLFDNSDILQTNIRSEDIIRMIDDEYGVSSYGSVKYSMEELYWIGYLYRYYAYTYDKSSAQAYRTIKPSELRLLYAPYHTLDTAQAIERILESKELLISSEEELLRQLMIFMKVRGVEKKC